MPKNFAYYRKTTTNNRNPTRIRISRMRDSCNIASDVPVQRGGERIHIRPRVHAFVLENQFFSKSKRNRAQRSNKQGGRERGRRTSSSSRSFMMEGSMASPEMTTIRWESPTMSSGGCSWPSLISQYSRNRLGSRLRYKIGQATCLSRAISWPVWFGLVWFEFRSHPVNESNFYWTRTRFEPSFIVMR